MGYLKDAVLPRVLDDATFATLSSLMLFNNIEASERVGRTGRLPDTLLEQCPDGVA